jgi:hypothetical protein
MRVSCFVASSLQQILKLCQVSALFTIMLSVWCVTQQQDAFNCGVNAANKNENAAKKKKKTLRSRRGK